MRFRRKGIAIVECAKGILVVAGRNKKFSLPGGGAKKGESRMNSAIRELEEETGLIAKKCTYLFSYQGKVWKSHFGYLVKNLGKVFLIQAEGDARPRHEIKYINYYLPDKKINISAGTKEKINTFLKMKENGIII